MATRREVIIKTADALGEVKTTTYSHVNTALTPTQIDGCVRVLAGLSKNTYIDTEKVDRESINEALAE